MNEYGHIQMGIGRRKFAFFLDSSVSGHGIKTMKNGVSGVEWSGGCNHPNANEA